VSILTVENLRIVFGGVVAIDGVSFSVQPKEIFALIGPNGAGKTTLFNMVSGLYVPDSGRIVLDGEDVTNLAPQELARRGMSRTFQNLQVFFRMTAVENVMVGRHLHEKRNILSHVLTLPSVHAQNRATRAEAERLLELVGLAGVGDKPASSLPYGMLKRLEIARALATEPKVLLLDEPAAGCNPTETEEIDAVIKAIAAQGVTVVLVEHDMRLVMRISNRIHVLDRGHTLAEGSAEEVRTNPAVIAAYLGGLGEREAAHARH
jgi:branched-chain amino acid transport system ATP-binding protein